MNNALLELFDEYENEAEGAKEPESSKDSFNSDGHEVQRDDKALEENEDSIIKEKLRELVPEDVDDSNLADFLDDFDKELELDFMKDKKEDSKNSSQPKLQTENKPEQSSKAEDKKEEKKPKVKLKIKPKIAKSEDPKPVAQSAEEISFDEFMELAEKEYKEKELRANEKNERLKARKERLESGKIEGASPSVSSKPEPVNSNIKDNEEEADIDYLIKKSGTYFREDWIEYYEKAKRSKKSNVYQDKLKRGLFRFNKEHQIEWLPDHEINGKSSEELLNEKWF